MSEDDSVTKSPSEEVSESLSRALFEARKAKGIIIVMAMDDDTIWSYASGDLVTRLGLSLAASMKAKEAWENSDDVEESNDP